MKALILRIEEAKASIVNAVNEAIKDQELPCYLVEPIVADIHRQISAGATKEYEQAKQAAELAEQQTEPET